MNACYLRHLLDVEVRGANHEYAVMYGYHAIELLLYLEAGAVQVPRTNPKPTSK
jgi:hypothetical protein